MLIDPTSVTVISQVEQESTDHPPSHNSSLDLSSPTSSFHKELQDLDNKWSVRMARLEALITMGQRSSPLQQPAFSPVKVPVTHQPPAGALSQTLLCSFLLFPAKPVRLLARMVRRLYLHQLLPHLHLWSTCIRKLIRRRYFNSPVQ